LEFRVTAPYFFIKKFGKSSIGIWRARASEEMLDGSVELDGSYLGGTRKGKKGRGAADKVVVFGILKRNDKVHTVVIGDARTATLMPIMSRKSSLAVLFTPIPGGL